MPERSAKAHNGQANVPTFVSQSSKKEVHKVLQFSDFYYFVGMDDRLAKYDHLIIGVKFLAQTSVCTA